MKGSLIGLFVGVVMLVVAFMITSTPTEAIKTLVYGAASVLLYVFTVLASTKFSKQG
ncbi:hypothetical protein [Vibrio cholerae]|uniref:hypothetical protein n=1 Tax=Vibrio cholerae TaxID=666 RepID=UPI0016527AF0|nr:hypothetical protein [Vibrio cholerae]GIB31985.1 hypothetical protein VCSRO91_2882 [Vibrio cholerae]